MPKTAVSTPSGKGGRIEVPSTKWVSGTWKGRSSRPGRASAGSGVADLLRNRKLIAIDCNVRSAHGTGLFRAGADRRALSRDDQRAAEGDVDREVGARLVRARPRGRLVLPAHQERDVPRPADRREVCRGGGAASWGGGPH